MNDTITSPAAGLSESGNAAMSCGEPGAALSVAAEIQSDSGSGGSMPEPRAGEKQLMPAGTAGSVTDVPLSWSRVFPATPAQAREARQFLADILAGSLVADDAILCLSELAANATVHSQSREPGGHFTVRAQIRHGDGLRIEVRDQGGSWTRHRSAHDAPHGRGLVIVARMPRPRCWQGWLPPPSSSSTLKRSPRLAGRRPHRDCRRRPSRAGRAAGRAVPGPEPAPEAPASGHSPRHLTPPIGRQAQPAG